MNDEIYKLRLAARTRLIRDATHGNLTCQDLCDAIAIVNAGQTDQLEQNRRVWDDLLASNRIVLGARAYNLIVSMRIQTSAEFLALTNDDWSKKRGCGSYVLHRLQAFRQCVKETVGLGGDE